MDWRYCNNNSSCEFYLPLFFKLFTKINNSEIYPAPSEDFWSLKKNEENYHLFLKDAKNKLILR